MEYQKAISGALAAAVLAGCATASKDITPTYVSPIQYQTYDCEQLSAESLRLTQRVQQLGGRLDEASTNDKTITAAGIILFGPALFVLGGTKQQEAEFARLKGEHDALQQAAIGRKCPGAMTAAAPAAAQPALAAASATAQPVMQPTVAPAK